MRYNQFIAGLLVWSLFVTLILFWVLWFAAQQSDRELVVISTWRLMWLLFVTNMLLTAILVKANNNTFKD